MWKTVGKVSWEMLHDEAIPPNIRQEYVCVPSSTYLIETLIDDGGLVAEKQLNCGKERGSEAAHVRHLKLVAFFGLGGV